MHPEAREELQIRFKKVALDMASLSALAKTCHEFGVARSTLNEWKIRYDEFYQFLSYTGDVDLNENLKACEVE